MKVTEDAASSSEKVGAATIAKELDLSRAYALQLIRAGAFGQIYDLGQGEHRGTPRVLRANVEAWVLSRRVGA